MHNGAVHVMCSTMREVVASAAKAELAGLFHNSKNVYALQNTLEELGHPQPPTPMQTDNTTSIGIATDNVKQWRSKSMDMRFYWIKGRVQQCQFHICWKPGK